MGRHVVGARVLQDVIERREELAQSIGEIIEDVASGWGVQVESMLIKDIIFSNDLQDCQQQSHFLAGQQSDRFCRNDECSSSAEQRWRTEWLQLETKHRWKLFQHGRQ